jgi:1,4-alpha-glucan branching enzyme
MIRVRFLYLTGQKRPVFRSAHLTGEWDGWAETPMEPVTGPDGCPAFAAEVELDDGLAGRDLRWGVWADSAQAGRVWAINLEVPDPASRERHRVLRVPPADPADPPGGPREPHEERYHLTHSRLLGAQKVHGPGAEADPALRFAVWAPNARRVDVLFARPDRGYIAHATDDAGIDPDRPAVPLAPADPARAGTRGIWWSDPLPDFASWTGAPYMFRIENAQGETVLRTDVHSRWQYGRGGTDPARDPWDGRAATLDGSVSCSVVVDQDVVRREFEPAASPPELVSDEEFWRDEHRPDLPVPTRVEDLVIYELHVGALGYPRTGTGTLADAMVLLDHLVDLGVNAVELLPMSEFSGALSWGYGDTHHFVVESSAGGRDKYKHFVRACHRRGIAVIQDVVYNHFDQNAERAEWAYDSTAPDENAWYWYEGRPEDHPDPSGGYLDNGSSGFAPRYHEEVVRQLFVSSAAEFVEEFHVDGLRVDLTQAIHRDNHLHADGRSVGAANLCGQKLLREWSRTLRLLRPSVMLIAEDHTGWPAVTQSPDDGGLGFDATWYADFYHHLVGDADGAAGAARLVREAGFGHDGPLAVGRFAGVLAGTRPDLVTYHESHDEAGNASGSRRTAVAAVNGAPLVGDTRRVAEARSRVAAGLSVLSAGTPMFFMGEEVVAQKEYRYDNVAESKEDLLGERDGHGAAMFRFYQDLLRLRRASRALATHGVDVVHAHDGNRVLAFTRRQGETGVLVVASLSNQPFADGYVIATDPERLPDGPWRETFNSDSGRYGGGDVGNLGAAVPAAGGRIEVRLPANGFVVLERA